MAGPAGQYPCPSAWMIVILIITNVRPIATGRRTGGINSSPRSSGAVPGRTIRSGRFALTEKGTPTRLPTLLRQPVGLLPFRGEATPPSGLQMLHAPRRERRLRHRHNSGIAQLSFQIPIIFLQSNPSVIHASARHSPSRFFDAALLHMAAPAPCLKTARKVALQIANTMPSARRTTPIDRFIKIPGFAILQITDAVHSLKISNQSSPLHCAEAKTLRITIINGDHQ